MPDLAPLAARSVRTALPPAWRSVLSSLAATPGKAAGNVSDVRPGAPLLIVTSADSPAFRRTESLSNRICLNRESAVGRLASDGGGAAPVVGNGPGDILPQGV